MEEPEEEPPDVNGFILYDTPNKKNEYRIPRETVQFQRVNDIDLRLR